MRYDDVAEATVLNTAKTNRQSTNGWQKNRTTGCLNYWRRACETKNEHHHLHH